MSQKINRNRVVLGQQVKEVEYEATAQEYLGDYEELVPSALARLDGLPPVGTCGATSE